MALSTGYFFLDVQCALQPFIQHIPVDVLACIISAALLNAFVHIAGRAVLKNDHPRSFSVTCFSKTPKQEQKKARMAAQDPVLRASEDRFVLFPIKYDALWDLYKKAEASFWTAEEVDLTDDKFADLTQNEQHFVKHVLAFFAASDGVVLENLAAQFLNEVQISEARAFYANQMFMETIHGETYSLLIDTYIKDAAEKKRLFGALETMPCIRQKYLWASKYMNKDQAFSTRLVAFACVEGIFFSGAFCAIFWLKKRGLMPGLTFSNELISRDEGMHCDFACELHRTMLPENRCSPQLVAEIIRSAVEIEESFIIDALPCSLIGMNAGLMREYVRFCADRLAVELGCSDKVFDAKNPFDWMELISLQGKTNFFEKRVGEYALASSTNHQGEKSFSMDEDF